jgi:hypothetical protein
MPDGPGMVFRIQKYKFDADQKTRVRPVERLTTAHIKLPLPISGLQDNIEHDYSSVDMGTARFSLQAGREAADALRRDGAAEAAAVVGSAVVDVGSYIARQTINNLSSGLGGLISAELGDVPNPYSSMLYSRTATRAWSFQWKLQPMNDRDSQELKEIINIFRYYSLAKMDGRYLDFPHEFQLAFVGTSGLYGMGSCFLRSMNVNYTPHGNPVFYAGTLEPQAVELSLNFSEFEPLTKDSIDGTQWAPKSLQGIE